MQENKLCERINVLILADEMLCQSLVRVFEASSLIDKIYINGRYNNIAENNHIKFIENATFGDYKLIIKKNNINLIISTLTVFGQNGVVDFFKRNTNCSIIGVTKYWTQLEVSKLFAKEFMVKHNLPYSQYSAIRNLKDLKKSIIEYGLPIVLKDDTLQCGFGSYICKTQKDCIKKAKELLKKNSFFLAEKFIKGEEVTLQMFFDGKKIIPFLPVRDYKRLGNNNEGINTGSMGSYVPVKLSKIQENLINTFVKKLENVLIKEKADFTGIFAADLIFADNKVFNLEFNMRPCSPEFEVILEHLNCDFLDFLYNVSKSDTQNKVLNYKSGITGAINIVHKDYKKHHNYKAKKKIKISSEFLQDKNNLKINTVIADINNKNETLVFPYYKLITLIKNDFNNPFPDIYKYLNELKNKDLYYRTDIGNDI